MFVNIQYTLTADMPRGMMSKNLTNNVEFVVEKEVCYNYYFLKNFFFHPFIDLIRIVK